MDGHRAYLVSRLGEAAIPIIFTGDPKALDRPTLGTWPNSRFEFRLVSVVRPGTPISPLSRYGARNLPTGARGGDIVSFHVSAPLNLRNRCSPYLHMAAVIVAACSMSCALKPTLTDNQRPDHASCSKGIVQVLASPDDRDYASISSPSWRSVR